MTTTQPGALVKTCQYEPCGKTFSHRTGGAHPESVKQFTARRFCSLSCASRSRTRKSGSGAVPVRSLTAPKGKAAADPPPTRLREVNGVWRPSAPGWPDVPGARS